MKMFKRLLTGMLSAALVLGTAMVASAEAVPSVAKGTKDNNAVISVSSEKGVPMAWIHDIDGYYLNYLPEKAANAIRVANAAQTETVNTVEAFVKAADDPVITAAFSDGKDWVWRSTFGNLVKLADGDTGLVAIEVPGIAGIADDVQFVHYSTEKGWQILKVSKVEGDKVYVEFPNGFSPSAIAVVLKKAVPTPAPAKTAATTTATTTASSNASPKTGVNTNWMGFAAAAAILAVCGAAMSRKKRA